MISVIARYHVEAGRVEDVLATLRRMATEVAKHEPACRIYRVGRPTDADDQVVLYEEYNDQAALEAHRTTDHYKRIIEGEVGPMLRSKEVEVMEVAIGEVT